MKNLRNCGYLSTRHAAVFEPWAPVNPSGSSTGLALTAATLIMSRARSTVTAEIMWATSSADIHAWSAVAVARATSSMHVPTVFAHGFGCSGGPFTALSWREDCRPRALDNRKTLQRLTGIFSW